jgi:hypothetical protein
VVARSSGHSRARGNAQRGDDELSDDELCTELASGEPVDHIAESLIGKANARGGADNIAAAVCIVEGPGLAEPCAAESVSQTFHALAGDTG